jgi:membrane associated rhomboid family serine protease
MIPLRDVIPSRTTPWITFLLIILNALVYLYQFLMPEEQVQRFIYFYGLVPAQFSWLNVFTSMFIHGGLLHLGGNLLSLWIFGDNVEDRMGHARFLLFYLLAGGVGGWLQSLSTPDSFVPMVGASGAIAGVMGAYLVLFPRSRILVLIFLFIFIDVIEIPSIFFLGFWFVMQLLSGVGQLASMAGANVGFWAHIGGFLTGLGGVFLFRKRERQRVEWWS